jgi:hypothetical protein
MACYERRGVVCRLADVGVTVATPSCVGVCRFAAELFHMSESRYGNRAGLLSDLCR